MNTNKVLVKILLSAAIGATVGILIAPDKGSKTRKKINNKAVDYSDNVKEKFNDLIENITNKFNNLNGNAQDFVEKNKTKLINQKNNY